MTGMSLLMQASGLSLISESFCTCWVIQNLSKFCTFDHLGGMAVGSPLLLSEKHRLALMSNGWFADLSETIREDILAHARKRALVSGERLFLRGDKPDGVYGVLQGCLCVSGINRNGRQTVLDFYGPGSWIGEVSVLEGWPRLLDAEADGSTVVLQIRPEDLETLLARHPALSRALLRLEAQRLRILLTAIEQYSTQSLEQRLATRLLMLAASHGVPSQQGLKIDLHLSQETLAQLIGATRQRVNTILKDLERKGLVEQRYGSILIRDTAKLEVLAET